MIAGVGLSLRAPLVASLLAEAPACVRWLEIAPENYMHRGGTFARQLAQCAERWPIATHGLTMSLGGIDPLDRGYLDELRTFIREAGSPWHSDHLSFSSVDGTMLHDLLPLPATEEAVCHVVARIEMARDALEVQLAIENISSYADPPGREMDEATFVSEVVRRSGAALLLDVNNVYVNAMNRGADPIDVIDRLPLDRVVEIHVAGHLHDERGMRIDTHGEAVCRDVFALLEHALEGTGPVPVLLERDQNVSSLRDVIDDLERLDEIWHRCGAARVRAA